MYAHLIIHKKINVTLDNQILKYMLLCLFFEFNKKYFSATFKFNYVNVYKDYFKGE